MTQYVTTANVILTTCMFAGIVGSIIPSLPGTTIIVAGALIHGFLTDFTPLNMNYQLTLAALALLAWGGQYVIAGAGSKKFGASKYGAIGAFVGMVVGLFLPIPAGIFVGTFLGAFLFEIVFALKDLKEAFRAGTGALLGAVASLFFEFFIAVAMVWMICAQVFF